MKKQEASVWLREGLTVLAESGPDSLTIDELCRRLHLTKGSFYHHYAHGMRNEMHHGKKPGSKRQSTWRPTKLLGEGEKISSLQNTIPSGMI